MMSALVELREGDTVCFALESVYLPTVTEALAMLNPADKVVGTVVHFSDSFGGARDFAVVSLAGKSNVVVPVNKLARVTSEASTIE